MDQNTNFFNRLDKIVSVIFRLYFMHKRLFGEYYHSKIKDGKYNNRRKKIYIDILNRMDVILNEKCQDISRLYNDRWELLLLLFFNESRYQTLYNSLIKFCDIFFSFIFFIVRYCSFKFLPRSDNKGTYPNK